MKVFVVSEFDGESYVNKQCFPSLELAEEYCPPASDHYQVEQFEVLTEVPDERVRKTYYRRVKASDGGVSYLHDTWCICPSDFRQVGSRQVSDFFWAESAISASDAVRLAREARKLCLGLT